MNLLMNGWKVRSFVYAIKGCDPTNLDLYGTFDQIPAYVFSATHHGDHDEFWVVLLINGKEVMRWNARHIASIEWDDAT